MGLLGLFAGSGSIWVEGWEPMLGGGRASDLGRYGKVEAVKRDFV